MAIDAPPGYVTRPTAAKLYNRSQRSLERDLDEAYKQQNVEVLSAFKLVTNDDSPRNAEDVTTQLVEALKQDGKNPAWCISTSWLEATYGKRGSPRPQPSLEHLSTRDTHGKRYNEEKSRAEDKRVGDSTDNPALPDHIDFLRERIRTLEREKQQEIDRNREREAKLFAQLEVKDKQISAWDEITQNITKGLATGQLTPALSTGSVSKTAKAKPIEPADSDVFPTVQIIDANVDDAKQSKEAKQGNGRRAQPSQRKKTATKKTADKPAQKQKRTAAKSGGKVTSTKSPAKKTTSTARTEPAKRGFLSRLFSP